LTNVGGNSWELVNSIQDGDGHTTGEMCLNVAVQQPGTGGVGLVSEDHPGTFTFGWDACVAVDVGRVYHVEFKTTGLSICHVGVVEITETGANDVELVGVLVDGVGFGERSGNLDDEVDPLVVVGSEDQIRVRDGGWALGKERGLVVGNTLVEWLLTVENPAPGLGVVGGLHDVEHEADVGGL